MCIIPIHAQLFKNVSRILVVIYFKFQTVYTYEILQLYQQLMKIGYFQNSQDV
jgi:hypothetical protein